MKLDRLQFQPDAIADFYEQGLPRLGAVCERTWHDRLEIVAEGDAARLWREDGALHAAALRFSGADGGGKRDAASDVFPGCPLTFRLAETLWRTHGAELRLCTAPPGSQRPPEPAVAAKTWRQQFPHDAHCAFGGFLPGWHFSLVATVRCEIQAIEQHWSAHRIALAWPGGRRDPYLEQNLEQLDPAAPSQKPPAWPVVPPSGAALIAPLLLDDLAAELSVVKARQQRYLQRELARVDGYFDQYARELRERRARRKSGDMQKYEERLKAAADEHERRREDQVQRHEIRIVPYADALLWVAERAWGTTVTRRQGRDESVSRMNYVPRLRRWFALIETSA